MALFYILLSCFLNTAMGVGLSISSASGFGFNRNVDIFQSPCPSIFQYQYDGSEWFGVLITPSVPYGTPARLIARFTIGRVLPTKYSGHLELIQPRAEVLNAILNELPIRYKVNFPISYPLPTISSITLNDRIICQGTKLSGPLVTSITLEHILYPHGQQLNAQPWQQFPKSDTEIIPIYIETSETSTLPNNPVPKPVPNLDERVYSDVCGTSTVARPLVANGDSVEKGSYPWLAALFAQKALGLEFVCGGNLISRQHVITAAHCIQLGSGLRKPSDLLVFLGKHQIHRWTEQGSIAVEVEEISVHPEYKVLSGDADLAVLRFSEPINFTPSIRPICIWPRISDVSELAGSYCTIVGWGRDESGLKITPEPRQSRVLVVSQEDCLRSKLEFRYITSNRTLCAGGVRKGAGPCSGDSGGGLLIQQEGKWYLRGIISMSLSNPKTTSCDLENYSVFVDMAKFVNWITQFLQ